MKKKIMISFVLLLLIASGIWGFFAYKKNSVANAVHEYLIDSGKQESDIVSLEPFIANLSGNENYMVAVKLKDDARTYYYYKSDDGKVMLESTRIGSTVY
ncbi:Protein of unknown function [Terribacillus halophilus]|uniref:DUF3139 domain-containing protein n=1 Tax=Terribacillus halophilus TaxID=361279 RepID=A0A1G6T8K6_9BACI|nr:DUF3139 domain-containing protein [Terribacillus halophilus]SDD25194.1 Protein of unknown function [Terribacillus halophilus]